MSILGVSLALSACGGSSGGNDEEASTAPPTPPPTNTAPPEPPPPEPPPPEPPPITITGVQFDYSSHQRLAIGSDNWAPTWSDDDQQYSTWGDGGGFDGTNAKGRVSFGIGRVAGDAANYQGANRYGGFNAECPGGLNAKAHGALLSVGGVLYGWISPQSPRVGYDVFDLYTSGDKGCTWTKTNVSFDLATQGISFGSFVQFGKDNSAARDKYVYTVATEVTDSSSLRTVQRPGRVMLLRVPVDSIEVRSAYEYYAGMDASGKPTWSSDPAKKQAIYEDADGVGPFSEMSFVPELERYVYSNQHGNGTDVTGMQSLLTIAEAPEPWGPWHVVFHEAFFPKNAQTVFQWSFAPKWFRNGGRDFTLVFSGTDANDAWNTVDGTFVTSR